MTDLEILQQIKALALQLHKDRHAADFEDTEHVLALDAAILLVNRLHGIDVVNCLGFIVGMHYRSELKTEVNELETAQ